MGTIPTFVNEILVYVTLLKTSSTLNGLFLKIFQGFSKGNEVNMRTSKEFLLLLFAFTVVVSPFP